MAVVEEPERAAEREPRVTLYIVKPVVGAAGVNTLAARRALKGALIIASPMVVVAAAMNIVPELLGEKLVYVFSMEVAKGVRGSIAPGVQKVILASASPMEVSVAVNSLIAQRVHRGAPFRARLHERSCFRLHEGAEGSTPFCKGHGGGTRCSFSGEDVCPKSVHGGTLYCVAHGGGKRCIVPECTKSARGRAYFCVRHGGGKRCKSEGCAKSAQGCPDFCKAHDGGKRCSWGQVGSDVGAGDPPCDQFARGKTGLCAAHSALVEDRRVHWQGTVGSVPVHASQLNELVMIKEVNMEDVFVGRNNFDKKLVNSAIPFQSSVVSLPERRVHGGSLMIMLASGAELEKPQRKPCGGKSASSVCTI